MYKDVGVKVTVLPVVSCLPLGFSFSLSEKNAKRFDFLFFMITIIPWEKHNMQIIDLISMEVLVTLWPDFIQCKENMKPFAFWAQTYLQDVWYERCSSGDSLFYGGFVSMQVFLLTPKPAPDRHQLVDRYPDVPLLRCSSNHGNHDKRSRPWAREASPNHDVSLLFAPYIVPGIFL